MAAPSHSHLLAPPQNLALALALPPSRTFSATRFRRLATRRLRLHPVAALGGADAGELINRVEAFLYTVADAAISASSEVAVESGGATTKEAGDWLSGITNSMETVLKVRFLILPSAFACGFVLAPVAVRLAQGFIAVASIACGAVSTPVFRNLLWEFAHPVPLFFSAENAMM